MKKNLVKITAGLILVALALGTIFCFPLSDVNHAGGTVFLMSCDRVVSPRMTPDHESLPKNRNSVIAASALVFLGWTDNIKVDFLPDQSSAGHKISPNSDLHHNSSLRNVSRRGASLSLLNQILRV